MKIKLAINQSFKGKPAGGDLTGFFREYNGRFENVELTGAQIMAEVQAGHGLTTQHRGYRHGKNFICGQHIGLDFDTEDDNSRLANLIQDPFIERYAGLLYTTASHTEDKPRARVLFFLDQPIYDPAEYTELATALLWHYGQADQSCKDPARLFFGAVNCQPAISGNVLPLEIATRELLTPFRAWQEITRAERAANAQTRRVVAAGDVAAAVLQNHSDKLLGHVRAAPDGQKHKILRDISRTFGGYVATGYYTFQDAEAWLQAAIRANPGHVKSLHAADRTISQGLHYGMMEPLDFTATAVPPTVPAYVKKPNYKWVEELGIDPRQYHHIAAA